MKEKTRKILIMAVMAALIISLMAASLCYAFTYGRYSGGRLDDNSTYDDLIDFVGATAFTVTSPEEFVNAIENGYSYIKIADGAEDPFVINEDIADVYTNLVLDVNGTTVIRNSRNPVLDVRRSISVVLVYDSSEGASGGFYNPVGSALQTSGGSLTIGSGSYESGPNVEGTETLSSTTATVYKRNGSRPDAEDYAFDATVTEMPSLGGDVYYTGDTTQYTYIENDTYLIYTEEENAFVSDGQLYVNAKSTSTTGTDGSQTTTVTGTQLTPICNVASCDFYYYYQIDAGETDNDYDQTYAVVYGYNDVKGLAEDSTDDTTAVDLREKGLAWPYAAIRSVEDGTVGGVTHARGGAFTTNFGTDNTYGILSVGGEMTVGTESATAPPTFTAVGEGTCIGMSAQTGDTLTIASGTFSSEVGDTILMRGGEMTVTGGTFTKTGSHPVPTGNPTATDYAASRTALIHMLGGNLTVNGTVGTDTSGNPTYSVNMTAESPNNTPLTNVFGIYSAEDDTSGRATAGTVSVSGCSIAVHGTYSAGILSSAGTVNVGGKENGKAETNITVNNSISNNLLTSSAVSSEGGTINLNNTVNISSDSLGITARGTITVNGGTTTVDTENATGVYVNSGTLTVKNNATLTVDSTISNASYSWVTPPESTGDAISQIYNGVYVNGGSLVSNGILNVTFTGVENDSQYSLTENEVDTVTNNSNMDYYTKAMNAIETNKDLFLRFKIKSYAVRVEGDDDTEVSIAAGKITNSVGGGVYVGGGHVTLGAKDNENESDPTISTEGNTYISRKYYYSGSISQDGWWPNRYDVYTTTSAGFIPISSGDVTTWRYGEPLTGGHAVAVEGGSLTVYGGSYTADLGNGILVNNTDSAKKVNIEGGNFIGYNGSFSYGDITGPAGYYGLKVVGGSVEITDGTFGSNTGTSNGSAFFMGTYSQETGASRSTVQINGGTYYSYDTDAITTFRYTDITISGEINVGVTGGERAALAMQDDLLYNNDTNYPDRYATIKVDQGTFTGTSFGIYYGAGFDQLSINGGTFNGGGGTGLHFAVVPNNQNVQIVKGTFKGSSAVSGNSAGSISTGNIIASGSWCFDGSDNAVCDREYNGGQVRHDYFQVGGGGQKQNGDSAENYSVALNDTVYNQNGERLGNFNSIGTIVVQTGNQITNE